MFHFGSPRKQAPAGTVSVSDLPHPGLEDPVRAFAYDALRAGCDACWLTLQDALFDAVGPLLEAMPDLRTTGVRWSGAGVLRSSRVEWWAFDGGDAAASVLLFTGDGLEIERLGLVLRRTMSAATVTTSSLARGLPRPSLDVAAAASATPVWQMPGFTRLAPRALLESGTATIAA